MSTSGTGSLGRSSCDSLGTLLVRLYLVEKLLIIVYVG